MKRNKHLTSPGRADGHPSVTGRLYPEGIRVTRYFLASLDPMLVLTMTGPTRPEGEAMP